MNCFICGWSEDLNTLSKTVALCNMCQENLLAEVKEKSEQPDYYTWHPVANCIQISQEFNGNLAQAIQYIWRSGCPGHTKEKDVRGDLKKAVRFIEFEIHRLEMLAALNIHRLELPDDLTYEE